MKSKFSIFMMVMALVFAMAVPAFAYTKGHVSSVPAVDDDGVQPLGTLTIQEDEDFVSDLNTKTFKITLTKGAEWDEDQTVVTFAYGTPAPDDIRFSKDTLYLKFPAVQDDAVDKVSIKIYADLDDFEGGDIEAVVDGMDSGVTSGTYVVGRTSSDDAEVTVVDTETIGQNNNEVCGVIRITESSLNSLGDDETIELKLPKDFEWGSGMDNSKIELFGGFEGKTATITKKDGRDLTIELTGLGTSRTERGIVEITPVVDVDKDADYGEVEISVEGDDFDQVDVVVAEYADWDVTLEVIDDVPTVIAGHNEEELATFVIDENMAESLIDGRTIDLELPEGVKIHSIDIDKKDGNADLTGGRDSDDYNEASWTVNNDGKNATEWEITLEVSIAADFTGDIVAEISGSAGAEGELVLGKAVAPVTVEAEAVDTTLGTQTQELGDIVITEVEDEAIFDGKNIIVELPDGVEWDGTPDVEVIEGNLELDDNDIDTDDEILIIPVDSQSSKPSAIKISDIKVTIDRTVPYGPIKAKVKGEAFAENYDEDAEEDSENFDETKVAEVVVANLVTPVENKEGGFAEFTIGSPVYLADGSYKVADAAPYVKEGRTYVPIRYLANALGAEVDYANKVVTLTKGDTTVELTIGSNQLVVNGQVSTMDIAPEINNGRTMLPARFVAEAFGAKVGFVPAEKKVVISME